MLKKAIERFIAERRGANNYSVDDMSKLFVLNRYIFKVPAKSKLGEPGFGGWIGIPHDETEINELWPFAVRTDGRLELIGEFGGYNGDDFQAVEEFDYFNQRFGRRQQR